MYHRWDCSAEFLRYSQLLRPAKLAQFLSRKSEQEQKTHGQNFYSRHCLMIGFGLKKHLAPAKPTEKEVSATNKQSSHGF
jgi:hypothetical protein